MTPSGPFIAERSYEAISAMQKCIRRGMELEAAMWFFELEKAGLFSWAASRLRVTAQEDIGLAAPEAVLFAERALDRAAEWYKKKNGAWRLGAANAILALARAPKSREADHFQAVAHGRVLAGPPQKVPDFALDKHTRRGKAMGRGLDHFRSEGAKLHRRANGDQYEEEAYRHWASGIFERTGGQTDAGLFEQAPGREGGDE